MRLILQNDCPCRPVTTATVRCALSREVQRRDGFALAPLPTQEFVRDLGEVLHGTNRRMVKCDLEVPIPVECERGLNLEAAKGKTNLFPAWYVPIQHLGAVGAPTFAVNWLPTGAESDIRLMVTSRLTACLFGMARTNGKLGVAHIQPDATAYTQVPETQRHALRQSGLRMPARVKGLTTLAAQGGTKSAFSVVGDDAYDRSNHECVTIVGVRGDNDHWAIYKQKWNTKTNTDLDVTTR